MCCPWPSLPMITQSAGPWECPLLKQWAGDWHTSLPCIRLASPIQSQDRAHMLMCMLNIHSYRCALAHIITWWWWQTTDMMSYQSSFCTISMRSFSLDVMTLLFFIHVECFTSCALHIHLTLLVSCICFVLWFSPSWGLQYQYFHYGIIYCTLIWCYFFFRFIFGIMSCSLHLHACLFWFCCSTTMQFYTFLETTLVTLSLLPHFIAFFSDGEIPGSPGTLATTFLAFGQ